MRCIVRCVLFLFLQVQANALSKELHNFREKRQTDDAGLIENHRFHWKQSTVGLGNAQAFQTADDYLRVQQRDPSDFFYLFTGDTQHFCPCSYNNYGCHAATNQCNSNGKSGGSDCVQRQSDYANRMQKVSMTALVRRLNASGQLPIKGLVINGDLTDFGHDGELRRFKGFWTPKLDNKVPLYLGLGNHDYDNNVGQCALEHCLNRMLRFFRSYVKDVSKLQLDLRTAGRGLFGESNAGSLAYAWDECQQTPGSESNCIHFVQLNNYPTYKRHVDNYVYQWKILSSMNWLSANLKTQGANKSIVINFHDFDTSFKEEDKRNLHRLLISLVNQNPKMRILAIFFAHIHEKVGGATVWCIGGRRVPLMYSGSVPGNNYILAHFSRAGMNSVYSFHVNDGGSTTADKEFMFDSDAVCVDDP